MLNVTTCNIMTGSGLDMSFGGSFSMAWLGMVMLFFIIVFSRKWLGEEFGIPFNIIFAFAASYLAYIVTISMTCSYKFALFLGLVGYAVGGIVVPMFMGDGGTI
jgi:hypothetical protein